MSRRSDRAEIARMIQRRRENEGIPMHSAFGIAKPAPIVEAITEDDIARYTADTVAPTETAAEHGRRVERESRRTIPAGDGSGLEDVAEYDQ